MRSIAIALTWEFWRRNELWILSAVMFMACVTLTMAHYGMSPPSSAAMIAKIHYRTLFYLFICIAFFTLRSQLDSKNKRLGFPAHLYIKPARTWVLVGWQMLLSAVTISLLYLISAACVYLLWKITWPLLGPILLLVAALASTQAVLWSMSDSRVIRSFVCLLALALLQIWHFSRYGAAGDYPNTFALTQMWTGLSMGELLTLAPILAAAYAIAVFGVSRDRRGDCVGRPTLWGRLAAVIDLLPQREKPFNSPAAAQFWREWREKDRLLPAVCGLWVAVIIILGVSGITDTRGTSLLFAFMLQIGLVAPLFAGLIVGQCGRKSIIDDFKATLPVSNARLSAMILRPGAAGLLSAAAIYIAGLLFMIGWYFMVGQGDAIPLGPYNSAKNVVLELGYGNTLLLVASGIVVAWGAMGLGASMTLMGRPWLLWGIWLAICSFGPALMVLDTLHTFNLIPFSIAPLFSSWPWTIGICCLLGTAWAFFAAHHRDLITSRTFCLGPAIWLMLCICVGSAWLPRDDPRLSTIVLVTGLLALAVAPLATAPLALAWNRHR
jgi:hypothetical protein